MVIVKFFHFISQHEAHIDPCTLSSQKLVVFLLICGSSIASIKLSHWHPEVNLESPAIIPLLPLRPLYISGLDGPNISFLFLKKQDDNKSILNAWRHFVSFCNFFSQRINSYASDSVCKVSIRDTFLGLRIWKNACEKFGLSVQRP